MASSYKRNPMVLRQRDGVFKTRVYVLRFLIYVHLVNIMDKIARLINQRNYVTAHRTRKLQFGFIEITYFCETGEQSAV